MARERDAHIRFNPADYEWVARHAAAAGVSFSEYVRTAAMARAWMDYARQNMGELAGLQTVYEAAARMIGGRETP
jgi:hypothetical protein